MQGVSLLPRIESLPENMSNQEDELERMLEEAERLAGQMRAAAVASNAHFESSSNNDEMHDMTMTNSAGIEIAANAMDAAVTLSRRQPPPPPPQHPPRQASGSTIDTGVPVSTVQIPQQPPSVDDLSLPSNIHVVSASDHYQHHVAEGGGKPHLEMEAAIRATQNMEKALHALGAATTTLPEEEEPMSPVPDSPPTVSRKTSPSTLHREFAEATSAASSSHNKKNKQPTESHDYSSAPAPRTTTTVASKPPPPPPTNEATSPPTSTSALPKEGDADYAPLKDYSFRPSKFAPDDSVTWEEVDTAQEHDDDFVPLRDYSNITPVKSAGHASVAVVPRRRGVNRKRRSRRILAAVTISLALLGLAYYLMEKAVEPTPNRPTEIPQREPVTPDNPPTEPIHTVPLPWLTEEDVSEADQSPEEDTDLEQAFFDYANHPVVGDDDNHEDDRDEYEEEFGNFIDIEPGHGFLCRMPLGWGLFNRCQPSSSRGERLDAILNAMFI